jgi:hypothetical protein
MAIETSAVWQSPQDIAVAFVKGVKSTIASTREQIVSIGRQAAAEWHCQRPHPLGDSPIPTKGAKSAACAANSDF